MIMIMILVALIENGDYDADHHDDEDDGGNGEYLGTALQAIAISVYFLCVSFPFIFSC